MAEQQIERVDPQPRPSRASLGQVRNPDPGRVYLLANPNEAMFGYDACLDDGWEPLMKGCKEKVVGARVATDGTNRLMVQGQIVMWKSKKEHDEYLASKATMAKQVLASPQRNETVEIKGNGEIRS